MPAASASVAASERSCMRRSTGTRSAPIDPPARRRTPMNDAFHHAPLPLPDPLLRPRGWRHAAEAGGAPPANGMADEPSPQQAVAMAVLGSANAPAPAGAGAFAQAAAASTRSRYATLVA